MVNWRKPPVVSGGSLRKQTIAEAPSGLSSEFFRAVMNTTETLDQTLPGKPKRADARRNYDKVVAAAREAFAERGDATSLEEIARRAGVGIGTLYRNFPNRQALLEAVYRRRGREPMPLRRRARRPAAVGRVRSLGAPPGRLPGHQAGPGPRTARVPRPRRAAVQDLPRIADGRRPAVARTRPAGQVVRADTTLWDIIQMVGGIAKIPGAEPQQIEHILAIALDGLRYRPAEA